MDQIVLEATQYGRWSRKKEIYSPPWSLPREFRHPRTRVRCRLRDLQLSLNIQQASTSSGTPSFQKICGIFIQPDGKHITLKMGTWITALAKDYKGYLQYDKIQGCDEHCNVCNMTVAPSNLTVLTPLPSVEQELKHTAQHTLCYTLILTNIYTQSVSIIHINTNTQRHRQEQKHTYTDNDTEKDTWTQTDWATNLIVCSLCSPLS